MNPQIMQKAKDHAGFGTMPAPERKEFLMHQRMRKTDMEQFYPSDPLNLISKRGFFAKLKDKFTK